MKIFICVMYKQYIEKTRTSPLIKNGSFGINHKKEKRVFIQSNTPELRSYYGTEEIVCSNCGEKIIGNPEYETLINAIIIHRYLQEQLLIVELYDKYMDPIPDNIMLVKYLIQNAINQSRYTSYEM